MTLPYKVATLLYCFNERDEVLLLERAQEPNLGLWSPCGGKLHMHDGESPYACACREAREEMGAALTPADLHLTGLVSEHGFQGNAHWLMFLFEVKRRLTVLPPVHAEGRFQFLPRAALGGLKIPQTDATPRRSARSPASTPETARRGTSSGANKTTLPDTRRG